MANNKFNSIESSGKGKKSNEPSLMQDSPDLNAYKQRFKIM